MGVFWHRAQTLCERRGGRPRLPVPNSPYVLSCGPVWPGGDSVAIGI